MEQRRSPRRPAGAALALSLACLGCERGCLSAWLADHGVGGANLGAPRAPERPPGDLSGTDCADGLARCHAGAVEVSRLAHVPAPCTAPAERPSACACPWIVSARCADGCVDDGVEVLASPEIAAAQLCRPRAPLARALGPADAPEQGICTDEEIVCKDGRIVGCAGAGLASRAVAVCLHGCAARIGLSSDHGPAATLDGAASILCARSAAERR